MPWPWEAVETKGCRDFGDCLAPKVSGMFRVVSLNVGSLNSSSCEYVKSNDLFSLIRKFDIDVMMLTEHGLNPRSMKRSSQWYNRLSGQFKHKRSHLAWNSTWQHMNPLMWGGTGYIVQGELVRRYVGTEDDSTGLARWTSVTLRGSDGGTVRIVSIYVPNNRSDGIVGVAAQHRNFMHRKGIYGVDAREYFWNTFKGQVEQWYKNGEDIVIAGNVNAEVESSEVEGFFSNFNMRELLMDRHGSGPETLKRNSRRRKKDGIWALAGLLPVNCGYMDYLNEWDHRLLWIDLDEKYVFGYRECMVVPASARRCILSQVKSVQNYVREVKKKYKESNFVVRVKEAARKLEADPNSPTSWAELDNLDMERASYMLYGEKHCRLIYKGKVPRSSLLSKKAVGVIFFKPALNSLKNRSGTQRWKCSRRKISRLQKEAGLLHIRWNRMNISKVEKLHRKAYIEYLEVKDHGTDHYKTYVRSQAEQMAVAKGLDPDLVEKQLLDRDRTKAEWSQIKRHIKGMRLGGLNKLIVPDTSLPTGRRECYDQYSIESALLQANKNKYL